MAEYSFPKRQSSAFVPEKPSDREETDRRSLNGETDIGKTADEEFYWFDHSETKVQAGDLGLVGLNRQGIILNSKQLEIWRAREEGASVPHIEEVKLGENEFLLPVTRNK